MRLLRYPRSDNPVDEMLRILIMYVIEGPPTDKDYRGVTNPAMYGQPSGRYSFLFMLPRPYQWCLGLIRHGRRLLAPFSRKSMSTCG